VHVSVRSLRGAAAAAALVAATLAAPVAAEPRVALVLSGGSARAFAHVGAIKALDAAGVRPEIVVGTSAGAIVGALYAAGLAPEALEAAAAEADWSLFADIGLRPAALGVVGTSRIREFVNRKLGDRPIEALPRRFAAVATDLQAGTITVFDRGDAGLAVDASAAIPGLFEPVRIGGRLYADGGLVSPLPVDAARSLGAQFVIAVDVIYPPGEGVLASALDVLLQTFLVQTRRIATLERLGADVVVAPPIPPTATQLTFADRARLIEIGEDAGRNALPAIRTLLRVRQAPAGR
jgi:NTE family protein